MMIRIYGASIFFISFLLSFEKVYSQNDLENHKKYWYYKSHLNNDFIKVAMAKLGKSTI